MNVNNVLVITRRLSMVEGSRDVVSAVIALDDWVDPLDCDNWVKDKVEDHGREFSNKFVEFKSAVFRGSVHEVIS